MKRRTFSVAALAVVVLVLAGCGGGYSNPVASPPPATGGGGGTAATVTITISGFAFGPNAASLKAGQTVAWKNSDSVSHTATADGGAFDTGVIAPGATSTPVTVSATGTFAYHCAIHPSMVASVAVTQ
jgi:plastocyanin